jgi:hypothetical protein
MTHYPSRAETLARKLAVLLVELKEVAGLRCFREMALLLGLVGQFLTVSRVRLFEEYLARHADMMLFLRESIDLGIGGSLCGLDENDIERVVLPAVRAVVP